MSHEIKDVAAEVMGYEYRLEVAGTVMLGPGHPVDKYITEALATHEEWAGEPPVIELLERRIMKWHPVSWKTDVDQPEPEEES
jgi:hypothetical protein